MLTIFIKIPHNTNIKESPKKRDVIKENRCGRVTARNAVACGARAHSGEAVKSEPMFNALALLWNTIALLWNCIDDAECVISMLILNIVYR